MDCPRRKKAFFFSRKLHCADVRESSLQVGGYASNFLCSGNQEILENAETKRLWGMAVTPAMRIRSILASPSKDSSERAQSKI